MTVGQAISFVDAVKPNAYTQATKLDWLSEIEGKIATEIRLEDPNDLDYLPYDNTDTSTELQVGVPYTGIYKWWLIAQVDLANQEYDLAQNTLTLFNNAWAEYLRWYCQRNDPVQEGYGYGQ